MSGADDHDCHDGETSPSTTTNLRHVFKRVTRKFTRKSPSPPSSPTVTHEISHPSVLANDRHAHKSNSKSFFGRKPSSWQTPQDGRQDEVKIRNDIQNDVHNRQPPNPHPYRRSSHSYRTSRGRSTSLILPYTAPPKPNLCELNPFPFLPPELVYAILVEAAHDHCSARRLVLVSRQVKWEVEKVLYANVHLGDMTAIRLFARTVREAPAIPRLPELRLGGMPGVGVAVGLGLRSGAGAASAREPGRERLLDDLREEEEGCATLVPSASHLTLMEKPTAARIKPQRLLRRLSQPPPPSPSSSSTLPVSPTPPPSLTPSPPTAVAAGPSPTGSTLTRAFFATTVRALMLVVQEDHFRILFPDVLECARLILCTCDAVRELEISGDLIRRTDPASIVVPVPTPAPAPMLVPAPLPPVSAVGRLRGTGTGLGPPVLPPISHTILNGGSLLPSTSSANPLLPLSTAASTSALPIVSTTLTPTLQTDLYTARMRPTHLTLLAPHNNVNFHLPMLQHVTHLRYAICPPRILGWRPSNDGLVSLGAGSVVTAHTNTAGGLSMPNHNPHAAVGVGGTGRTGQGRLLRRLTHVAFDYQIGREGGHGGMGIGIWGAGNFVGIVREALAAGGGAPAAPPLPLNGVDGGLSPLAPHAEDGEGEGIVQGPGAWQLQGSGEGAGAGADAGEETLAAGAGAGALGYLDEQGEAPPLERVVVKIILRPRAEMLSKFNAIWPRLDAMRKADPRLVYFGAKWRDNEMFGENLWERVRAVEERRDRERERGRGGGARQRSNSAVSSATAGGAGGAGAGGGGGGRRRRASSVSIGWFQDG